MAEPCRRGSSALYSWSETPSFVEVHVRLPTGTKRSQLKVSLRDGDREAWRNEIETAGGEDRPADHARLLVQPAFWPQPLLDGTLRGAVHLKECSFQVDEEDSETGSGGKDHHRPHAGTRLVIVLAKARVGGRADAGKHGQQGSDRTLCGAVGDWWGGVLADEDAAPTRPPDATTRLGGPVASGTGSGTGSDSGSGTAAGMTAGMAAGTAAEGEQGERERIAAEVARHVQRMASRPADVAAQRDGARACAALARRSRAARPGECWVPRDGRAEALL